MIVSQDPVVSQKDNKQWAEADKLNFVKDVRTNKAYDMPWPWGENRGVVDFTSCRCRLVGEISAKPIG